MKQVKLGLDVRAMTKDATGIGMYMREMTRELKKCADKAGWQTVIFPGKFTDLSAAGGGFEIYKKIKNNNSLIKRSVYGLPLAARAAGVDIFYSMDFSGPCFAPGFRMVNLVHDIMPALFPASKRSRFICRFLMPVMFKSADIVVAVSEHTKKDIIKTYGVKSDKIRVIYPGPKKGIGMDPGREEIERVKAKFGTGQKYFLFLSMLEPKKNPVKVAEAFLEFRKKAQGYKMVFAGGKGWGVDRLYDITKNDPDFVFTGYAADSDVPGLLHGASAFIFPSLYEGFGLPALDALCAGVPLITSGAASLPEVAGDAALTIDPLNTQDISAAMEKIALNKALAARLSEAGKKQASKFSWEKSAGELMSLFEDLINNETANK